jgi:hypothetical protein
VVPATVHYSTLEMRIWHHLALYMRWRYTWYHMGVIRVTRGIPAFNIQIGPIMTAVNHNASAIISVTDLFEPSLMYQERFHWVPVNEIAHSWGYLPFFTLKKLLDFYVQQRSPLIYLCCSAGKHRSPLMGFCWLLSLGKSLEQASEQFFGKFDQHPVDMYKSDLKNGIIPHDLPQFYETMNEFPGLDYRSIMINLGKYERITYHSSGSLVYA